MYLTHLSLTNFRNYARLDVDIPKAATLLIGANAQGKTSLLEAIYYLATFVSFHASSDRQLISFLAGQGPLVVARIVAEYCSFDPARAGHRKHNLEVRIIREHKGHNGAARVRKEILLDGVKKKASEAIGHFNAVLFLPQTLRIIEGSPEERRRYLNLTLAQVIPDYARQLTAYTRTLAQRNALLKLLNERQGDLRQLEYWDQQLTAYGAKLIYARIQALHELEEIASAYHAQLSRGAEVLRLAYNPSYDPLPQPDSQMTLPLKTPVDRSMISIEQIESGFINGLERLRKEEIARGMTTIGPHRDELRFVGNGIDLGVYGSRGQARTAILALKLAEVSWMYQKKGDWPVLLLDEVMAELDAQRRLDLLDKLAESEQALLTTTDLATFSPQFIETATCWKIEAGRLAPAGESAN